MNVLSQYLPALPEIFLLCGICAVLLLDLFLRDSERDVTYYFTQVVLIVTALLVISVNADVAKPVTVFNEMYVADAMTRVLKIAILVMSIALFLYTRSYLKLHRLYKGEYFVLGLFAVLGMLIMVSANSMLLMYLGLELMSLSLYAMVAFKRDDGRATEAAMKYFVLGAIASGMLLYGMSLVYGLTGSLKIDAIAQTLDGSALKNVGLLLALAFILVGFSFKLGLVPFHMWVPDVYDGAPTAVTMFLGSIPKIAAFAIIIRLLGEGLQDMQAGWQQILSMLVAVSLLVGNLIAIAQTNIKRMLAYSTISHMGFMVMGLLAGTTEGYAAAMFYVMTYALIAIGGFAVLIWLSREGLEVDQLVHLKGLAKRHPWYAFMLLLFLFSMAGIPPTVGFYAKLSVISAAVNVGLVWLAVFAVIMSVIGAYYYLRAIKLMYFDEPEIETRQSGDENGKQGLINHAAWDFDLLISVNGLAVLVLGILPGALMSICMTAIRASL